MKKKIFCVLSAVCFLILFSSNTSKGDDDYGQKNWDVYEHCDDPCPSISCVRGGNEACSMDGHCSKELRKASNC